MTIAETYLGGSQVFQRLKNGPNGQLIERYAARLVEDGLARPMALGDASTWLGGLHSS